MKVLITGDRNWTNLSVIEQALAPLGPGTIIVHGAARGADRIAGFIAKKLGYEVRPYPAKWKEHGKAAGPIRNVHMFTSERPELVLAFHNDLANSKGTKHMVEFSKGKGVQVRLFTELGEVKIRTLFGDV